jgi:hypothetical protein
VIVLSWTLANVLGPGVSGKEETKGKCGPVFQPVGWDVAFGMNTEEVTPGFTKSINLHRWKDFNKQYSRNPKANLLH